MPTIRKKSRSKLPGIESAPLVFDEASFGELKLPEINVLIVDDHLLFSEALGELLSKDKCIRVVATAANGEEALKLVKLHQPDLILMDLSMPGMSGAETTRRILVNHPKMRVLVITTHGGENDIFDALRAGAVGYILKNCPVAEMIGAIKIIAAGNSYLAPCVTSQVLTAFRSLTKAMPKFTLNKGLTDAITPRELDIVRLVASGHSNKEIAGELSLVEGSVKNVISRLLVKFKAPDRTTIAIKARDMGLV
jgi:DNA-binding NarL/FixJ family response regulator